MKHFYQPNSFFQKRYVYANGQGNQPRTFAEDIDLKDEKPETRKGLQDKITMLENMLSWSDEEYIKQTGKDPSTTERLNEYQTLFTEIREKMTQQGLDRLTHLPRQESFQDMIQNAKDAIAEIRPNPAGTASTDQTLKAISDSLDQLGMNRSSLEEYRKAFHETEGAEIVVNAKRIKLNEQQKIVDAERARLEDLSKKAFSWSSFVETLKSGWKAKLGIGVAAGLSLPLAVTYVPAFAGLSALGALATGVGASLPGVNLLHYAASGISKKIENWRGSGAEKKARSEIEGLGFTDAESALNSAKEKLQQLKTNQDAQKTEVQKVRDKVKAQHELAQKNIKSLAQAGAPRADLEDAMEEEKKLKEVLRYMELMVESFNFKEEWAKGALKPEDMDAYFSEYYDPERKRKRPEVSKEIDTEAKKAITSIRELSPEEVRNQISELSLKDIKVVRKVVSAAPTDGAPDKMPKKPSGELPKELADLNLKNRLPQLHRALQACTSLDPDEPHRQKVIETIRKEAERSETILKKSQEKAKTYLRQSEKLPYFKDSFYHLEVFEDVIDRLGLEILQDKLPGSLNNLGAFEAFIVDQERSLAEVNALVALFEAFRGDAENKRKLSFTRKDHLEASDKATEKMLSEVDQIMASMDAAEVRVINKHPSVITDLAGVLAPSAKLPSAIGIRNFDTYKKSCDPAELKDLTVVLEGIRDKGMVDPRRANRLVLKEEYYKEEADQLFNSLEDRDASLIGAKQMIVANPLLLLQAKTILGIPGSRLRLRVFKTAPGDPAFTSKASDFPDLLGKFKDPEDVETIVAILEAIRDKGMVSMMTPVNAASSNDDLLNVKKNQDAKDWHFESLDQQKALLQAEWINARSQLEALLNRSGLTARPALHDIANLRIEPHGSTVNLLQVLFHNFNLQTGQLLVANETYRIPFLIDSLRKLRIMMSRGDFDVAIPAPGAPVILKATAIFPNTFTFHNSEGTPRIN